MQGQRDHGHAHYRCRYLDEYALADRVAHPLNVYLPERAAAAGRVADACLRDASAAASIEAMYDAQPAEDMDSARVSARGVVAKCGRKIARYREALSAGADPSWSRDGSPRSRRVARRSAVAGERLGPTSSGGASGAGRAAGRWKPVPGAHGKYYRCPARTLAPGSPALASHPPAVYLREGPLRDAVNSWIGHLFDPANVDRTVAALVAS